MTKARYEVEIEGVGGRIKTHSRDAARRVAEVAAWDVPGGLVTITDTQTYEVEYYRVTGEDDK